MTKQELTALGISEEAADKVLKAYESYVPKAKLDEAVKTQEALQAQLGDRDKQLEELKKTDTAGLQARITELQAENKTATETHQAEMTKLQKRSALTMALRDTVHDPQDIIALLDMEQIALDKSGVLKGSMDDLLKPIRESKPYLFREKSDTPTITGIVPGKPGTIPEPTNELVAEVFKGFGIEPPKK